LGPRRRHRRTLGVLGARKDAPAARLRHGTQPNNRCETAASCRSAVAASAASPREKCAYAALPRTHRRGECNDIGAIDLADAIYLLNYIFEGAAAPHCLDACDMNDDGHVNLADTVFILVALYEGGAPPAAPYLVCGVDEGADAVTCEVYAGCP
jgi:hypothetical protein